MVKGDCQFVVTYGLNESRVDLCCLDTARDVAASMSLQGKLVEIHCLSTHMLIFYQGGKEIGTKQLPLKEYHDPRHSSRRK